MRKILNLNKMYNLQLKLVVAIDISGNFEPK